MEFLSTAWWSALLAIGFFVGLSPYIWTYFLGLLSLFALAVGVRQHHGAQFG